MADICSCCGRKIPFFDAEFEYIKIKDETYKVCTECNRKMNACSSGDISVEEVISAATHEKLADYLRNFKSKAQIDNEVNSIMVTSGYNFEGYRIIKYCDYISAETVFGMGMFKSLLASISSVVGAESEAFNNKIKEAKARAVYEIRKNALELGANAIIGIDIDFSMIAGEMVVIIASGTAVVIEKI